MSRAMPGSADGAKSDCPAEPSYAALSARTRLSAGALLDGLTHRATVAAAKDRSPTCSEDKLKAAKRMWRGMDEVDRENLTGC
jgi:hypothetical protein